MKRFVILLTLVSAMLFGLATPALAQGITTVWTWTGGYATFNSAGWGQYQATTYCVYANNYGGIKYVPAGIGYAGRLYCAPALVENTNTYPQYNQPYQQYQPYRYSPYYRW